MLNMWYSAFVLMPRLFISALSSGDTLEEDDAEDDAPIFQHAPKMKNEKLKKERVAKKTSFLFRESEKLIGLWDFAFVQGEPKITN